MKYRWKFLRDRNGTIKSNWGNLEWKLNKWEHVDNKLVICNKGLHCSKEINQALLYVHGEILARVAVKGNYVSGDNNKKEAYESMKIVQAYKWTKRDSVELAIYCAELVLSVFEANYPTDKRPRLAIEAAKQWLLNPNTEIRAAAYAAAAAAYAAAAAAYAAADAADAAAAAAYAAADAADAAAAAYAAAAVRRASNIRVDVRKQVEEWLVKRIKKLEEIK